MENMLPKRFAQLEKKTSTDSNRELRQINMKGGEILHPLIICGVGRSGTSLLQSMVDSNPDVCFLPETGFLRNYVLPTNLFRSLFQSRKNRDLIKRLEDDEKIARLELKPDFFRRLASEQGDACAFDIYQNILSHYLDRYAAKTIGDKDPNLIMHLRQLHRRFPDSKVVHVIRDPRDVLVSKLKADWAKNRPWWQHCFIYRLQQSLGRYWGHRLFEENYIEIKYERLIQEPESALKKLCADLELKYDDKMLAFTASSRRLVAKSEMQWKQTTLGPIKKNNFDNWRTGLSAWQIRFTETVCQPAFSNFGYQLADNENELTRNQLGILRGLSILLRFLPRKLRK